MNFLGLIAVRLPLAMLLAWREVPLPGGLPAVAGAGLGVVGAWYAMAADLAVRGLAMLVLFRRKGWSRVKI
ncbi:MAG: hypothetical protein EBZ59_09920 [Planctomycetia bacterium]|nr:hypothetical protein [Planctomycetia bacterium]